MKRILLFLLLSSPLFLPSQNWQNICSPGVTLYQKQSGGIQAFRLDSIQLPGNGDTLFFSFLTIRHQQPCADIVHGSVLGRKVYKTSSGGFSFYNKNGDTIYINSTGSLNEQWKLCILGDSGYLQATVSELSSIPIFGIDDSLKIITLQAFLNNGQPFTHPANSKEIHLSQSFGLVLFYDVYYFPSSIVSYDLIGKDEQQLGIQAITPEGAFDFNIGDIFHYKKSGGTTRGENPGNPQDPPPHWGYDGYVIKNILQKTLFPEYVSYLIERCDSTYYWSYEKGESKDIIHDTIIEQYYFATLANSSFGLPIEFRPQGSFAHFYQLYISTITSEIEQLVIRNKWGLSGTCWEPTSPLTVYAPLITEKYNMGLGQTYYYNNNYWFYFFHKNELVYYEKEGISWGVPEYLNCDELVSTSSPEKTDLRTTVYPNPTQSAITVSTPNFKHGQLLHFELFDFLGQAVFEASLLDHESHLNLPSLPPGLFIWQVTGDAGTATGKLVLE